MKPFDVVTRPLGMLAAVVYVAHTILGAALWPAYDSVTTDISSLTAVGAPNRGLLLVLTTVYGLAAVAFGAGMVRVRWHSVTVRAGWILFTAMQTVSLVGYALFPLSGDKSEATFTNVLHLVTTGIVVATTIASAFTLAVGYLRQDGTRRLGWFVAVMAVVITTAGASNPICLAQGLDVLGLTERAVIYALQVLMAGLSAAYTMGKGPVFGHKESHLSDSNR